MTKQELIERAKEIAQEVLELRMQAQSEGLADYVSVVSIKGTDSVNDTHASFSIYNGDDLVENGFTHNGKWFLDI